MKRFISRLQQGGRQLIALYTDRDSTDKFALGYLIKASATHVMMGVVDQYGNYDGYLVKSIDDVFLVEQSTQYINKVAKLYTQKKQCHSWRCESEDSNLFEAILNYSKACQRMVSIQLLHSGYSDARGFIDSMEDGVATVTLVNEYGAFDGLASLTISDITSITCDSQDEAAIQTLLDSDVTGNLLPKSG